MAGSHTMVDDLNAHLDALFQNTLSSTPYIQRIRQSADRPVQRPTRTEFWHKGTFFDPTEHDLQYLTFRKDMDGIVESLGSWDDGNGGIAQEAPRAAPSSNTGTPRLGPTKTISFAAYQARKLNKGVEKSAARKAPETANSGTESVNAQTTNGHQAVASRPPCSESPAAPSTKEIPATASQTSEKQPLPIDGEEQPKPQNQCDARSTPAKASKASTQASATAQKDGVEVMATSTIKEVKKSSPLPPMLSPTLPSIVSPQLPPLLSNTFAPEIEAAIQRARSTRPSSANNQVSTNGTSVQVLPTKRPYSGTAVTSKKSTSGPANPQSKFTASLRVVNDRLPKETGRETLIVKLKIRKKDRSKLSQYLRLKPSPNRGSYGDWDSRKRSSEQQKDAEDSDGPRKRRRSSPPAQANSAPKIETIKPPTSHPTPTPKPNPGPALERTPSHSMKRVGSNQGSITTPQAPTRHPTPSSNCKESPGKQHLREDYRAESAKIISIARELKHDRDRFVKQPECSEEDLRRSLVVGTESVMAFLLGFAVADEPSRQRGQPGYVAQWKSILPFLANLLQYAKPYRHLSGILHQLEGVIRDTIHEMELGGLRNMIRECERSDAPDHKAVLHKQQSFCKELYDNQNAALEAWRKGQASLWTGDIKQHFPDTWKAARKTPSMGKGKEPVILKDYARNGFALPMGNLTTSLEAVNATMSLLSEFCLKEKVTWKPKLIF